MKRPRKTLPALVLSCLLLSIGTAAAGAEVELLVYKRDPWLMVIGSDSPIFAYYTDGAMIFLERAASGQSGPAYRTVRLNEAEQAELQSRMKVLDSLRKYYELTEYTDQETIQITFRSGGKLKHVSSYGGVAAEMAPFIHFLDALQTRTAARAEPWRPSHIEVMLGPLDRGWRQTAPWPEEFPGLDSPAAKKRRDSQYSIYLPAADEEKFRTFMESGQGNPILLDGKIWSAHTRIPFPHEIPAALATTSSPNSENGAERTTSKEEGDVPETKQPGNQ